MKYFKPLFGLALLFAFLLSAGPQLSSCTKTKTVVDSVKIIDTVYDLTDGLVASYSFNGGSLKDSSGLGNDIVFNNAKLTSDRFGRPNNAYLFSGDSAYMRVKNSPSLNFSNTTIYAMVKVDSFYTGPCGGNQILSKGYPYNINGLYELGFNDPTSACGPTNYNNEIFSGILGDDNPLGTAPVAGTDTVIIKKGQWYSVIFTYDGLNAKLYINGALKDSRQISGSFSKNSYDLLIGKHENPSYPYYFSGVIDEIKIYSRALTLPAITQMLASTD